MGKSCIRNLDEIIPLKILKKMSLVTSKELVRILRKKKFNGSLVDKLKVYYRPFICPFNELLAFAGESTGFYIKQFKTKRLLWYPHYTIEALKV